MNLYKVIEVLFEHSPLILKSNRICWESKDERRGGFTMDNLYLSISRTIKLIQEEGFTFNEALRIYKVGSKELESMNDSNYLFFDALFMIDEVWTKASEAYELYCDWAIKNEVEPITQTRFGRIVSKVAKKKKSKGNIYYEMSVKNEI